MMQLIILGQVPGTHFQLTYGWFQLMVLPILGYVGYRFYQAHLLKQIKQAQRQFEVISLRNLDQA